MYINHASREHARSVETSVVGRWGGECESAPPAIRENSIKIFATSRSDTLPRQCVTACSVLPEYPLTLVGGKSVIRMQKNVIFGIGISRISVSRGAECA